ncbi:MAG: hypothetical protein LBI42_00010 [Chitinispirillales bacterium]|jgi:transcriptional regulator with XRE-family HTH domain|nr:hypothetical protein [Chitinispirillales bacterium]
MRDSQQVLEILLDSIHKKGMTEKDCLLMVNINTSFFTEWKKGRVKNPSYNNIVIIADFLELDLNYLFLGKPYLQKQIEQTELLEVVKSQQETIKTLSDTVKNLSGGKMKK